MLGTFQQSQLRIEVAASASAIRDSLLCPGRFQQWLWFQRFSTGLPEQLQAGTVFTSWFGPVAIQHQVAQAADDRLCVLLSQGVNGYQEWRWGDGWVQSSLAGVSLLPLNLGQTTSLLQLRQFLERVIH
jgi:hypothetical protein